MPRTIERGAGAARIGGAINKDTFLAKLAKYIPAEMTALFIFCSGIIDSMNLSTIVYWGIFMFVIVFAPIYLVIAAAMENRKFDKAQVVISPFAVIVWVFALGGPFTLLEGYNQGYGALLLAIVTTIIPLVDYGITKYLESRI